MAKKKADARPPRAKAQPKAKDSPFGQPIRERFLEQHFKEFGAITPTTAWKFVFEELLWFDKSNGLAHFYEADKVRPGRSSWYERSIRFTNRLQELFGDPDRATLKARLDKLFLACLNRLLEEKRAAGTTEALKTDESDEEFILDAELIAEMTIILVNRLKLDDATASKVANELADRARVHFKYGSNRQNVLGEGFEDLLRLLITKVAGIPADRIIIRRKADTLPGFVTRKLRRIHKPDIAIESKGNTALLATVKWSIRQDRQNQLADELDCYIKLHATGDFPQYVFVTNENDPGRLKNVADINVEGRKVEKLYHMNLSLLVETLSDVPSTAAIVQKLIDDGRLFSLEDFLNDLARWK